MHLTVSLKGNTKVGMSPGQSHLINPIQNA